MKGSNEGSLEKKGPFYGPFFMNVQGTIHKTERDSRRT